MSPTTNNASTPLRAGQRPTMSAGHKLRRWQRTITGTKRLAISLLRPSPVLADERGIELIEFLALFPLILLVLLIAWQFILLGYTGIMAAAAAREGARAAVTLEDVGQAVIWGSPGFGGRRQWKVSGGCPTYAGTPVSVEVQLEVPHVTFPFIGALNVYPKVTAVATMRCEPPFDSH